MSPFYVVIALLHLLHLLHRSDGTTISVSIDYNTTECVTPLYRCTSISAALAIANDNDIISLQPGTYSGTSNRNLCSYQSSCASQLSLVGNTTDPSTVVLLSDDRLAYTRAINCLDGAFKVRPSV